VAAANSRSILKFLATQQIFIAFCSIDLLREANRYKQVRRNYDLRAATSKPELSNADVEFT